MLVDRGNCKFDNKVLNAQMVGADLIIMVNLNDEALQRIGVTSHQSSFIGIPAVLITEPAGKFIKESLQKYPSSAIQVELTPSKDDFLASSWIEMAFTNFTSAENEQEKVLFADIIFKTLKKKTECYVLFFKTNRICC